MVWRWDNIVYKEEQFYSCDYENSYLLLVKIMEILFNI